MAVQVTPYNPVSLTDLALNKRNFNAQQEQQAFKNKLTERQIDMAAEKHGMDKTKFRTEMLFSLGAKLGGKGAVDYLNQQLETPLPPEVVQRVSPMKPEEFRDPEQFAAGAKEGVDANGNPVFFQAGDQGGMRVLPGVAPKSSQDSFGRSLIEAVDKDGNKVFVQASSSGGAEAVEGFTPLGQTPKELADERRAQVSAEQAEFELQQSKEAAVQADSTRMDIVSAAEDLMSGDIDRVFGSVFGVTEPILSQEGRDLEAKRERLSSLLTMGNLGKMKGVLSDTDIRILASAGSLLNDRGISVELANQELKRIRDVFSRNKEKFDGAAESASQTNGTFTSQSGISFEVTD